MGYRYGGRQKGTPNKATREVKELAQQYTAAAIRGLVKLAKTAKSEQARVAAWREVLDRACGKPQQAIDLSNSDGSLAAMFAAAVREASGVGEAQDQAGSTATH